MSPAGADRIDHDQVGESEPGLRIVLQAGGRGIIAGELEDPRPDQTQMQIGRRRARAAVESEGYGTVRSLSVLGDIGGVIDRSRALARLIEQRERAGGRGIGELAAGNVDAVLGHRVRRQEPQYALAGLGRPLFPLPLLLGPALLGLLRRQAARTLLRARNRGRAGDQ